MDNLAENFGNRLRDYIKERGWTIKEASLFFNISVSTLNRWTGKNPTIPDTTNLKQLIHATGLPSDYWVGTSEIAKPADAIEQAQLALKDAMQKVKNLQERFLDLPVYGIVPIKGSHPKTPQERLKLPVNSVLPVTTAPIDYCLIAGNNNMSDSVHEGEYVLIEKTGQAKPNQIVYLEDRASGTCLLKRLTREGDRLYLTEDNTPAKTIFDPSTHIILGVCRLAMAPPRKLSD